MLGEVRKQPAISYMSILREYATVFFHFRQQALLTQGGEESAVRFTVFSCEKQETVPCEAEQHAMVLVPGWCLQACCNDSNNNCCDVVSMRTPTE